MAVGQSFLLPPPFDVLKTLFALCAEGEFYLSVLTSVGRIALGFFTGFLAAALLAPLSVRFRRVEELLAPLVFTVKTVPVASFIILVLIWISSRNLSVVIAFMMVFPILYTNIGTGIRNTDRELLEMAEVFRLSKRKLIRYIYLPQIMPLLDAGASLSIGLAWKAGIAAEIIGLPKNSIGEHLYHAKIYFETEQLFAWTIVIICLSVFFEKLFLSALRAVSGIFEEE